MLPLTLLQRLLQRLAHRRTQYGRSCYGLIKLRGDAKAVEDAVTLFNGGAVDAFADSAAIQAAIGHHELRYGRSCYRSD